MENKHLLWLFFASLAVNAAQDSTPASSSAHDMHDMSGMSNMSDDDGMTSMPPAVTESRTPIPPVTDKDRKAAFAYIPETKMHGDSINYLVVLNQLEWQRSSQSNIFNWDATGWIGGDINRLWIKSEGENVSGKTESAEIQALWGHSIGPWWDITAGVRQDFKPASAQTWGAIGFQGMALYNFESSVTAFVGNSGRSALRLEGEYDILLTNKLILQPAAEINFYSQNDKSRGIGRGLSDSEIELRLRYEIRREFAPYIGVSWKQLYGNTSDMAKDEGEKDSKVSFLMGARVWF